MALVVKDGQLVDFDNAVVTYDLAETIAELVSNGERTVIVQAEDRTLSVSAEPRVVVA